MRANETKSSFSFCKQSDNPAIQTFCVYMCFQFQLDFAVPNTESAGRSKQKMRNTKIFWYPLKHHNRSVYSKSSSPKYFFIIIEDVNPVFNRIYIEVLFAYIHAQTHPVHKQTLAHVLRKRVRARERRWIVLSTHKVYLSLMNGFAQMCVLLLCACIWRSQANWQIQYIYKYTSHYVRFGEILLYDYRLLRKFR